MPELGACLRRRRRNRGMTLDQLATASGVDRGSISRIEMGHVSPRLETLEALCQALEIRLGELLASTEEGAGQPAEAANWTVPASFWKGMLEVMDRFEGLFRSSRELIFVLGPAGEIRFASPPCEATLGRPNPTLVGKSFQDLLHPGDLAPFQRVLADLAGAPQTWRELTLRVHRRGDDWRTLAVRLTNQLGNPAIRALVMNAVEIGTLEGPAILPE
jgi:PAS domain S-box-containing protein